MTFRRIRRIRTTSGAIRILSHLDCGAAPDRALFAGERALGDLILPAFQRPSVWTAAQKVRLLESVVMGLPIGAIVVNRIDRILSHDDPEAERCADLLLDGQQRLTALQDFIQDGFRVDGRLWSDWDVVAQRAFRAIPLGEVTSNLTRLADCEDLYHRLAYGGTPHAA